MSEETPDRAVLAQQLLDAAVAGRFTDALDAIRTQIDQEIDPQKRFEHLLLIFDVALLSTQDSEFRTELAIDLAAAANSAGEEGWQSILPSPRFEEITSLAAGPEPSLELLELLAASPDTSVHSLGVAHLESLAMRAANTGGDTRTFERLLHAVGERDAAYGVESRRKLQHRQSEYSPRSRRSEDAGGHRFVRIAIAGGSPSLRATTRRLLARTGRAIVEIPSSTEAVRRERDIADALRSCDLALILRRQITHSTSDQVRSAAGRLGIPVTFSNALSTIAIERHVDECERTGTGVLSQERPSSL